MAEQWTSIPHKRRQMLLAVLRDANQRAEELADDDTAFAGVAEAVAELWWQVTAIHRRRIDSDAQERAAKMNDPDDFNPFALT